ncbi:MAG: glutaredoxin [Chloroflexota bacterium]
MDVVIYSRRDCVESAVMRDYLARMGVDFRELAVDGDAAARQDWEDLDGQVTPLLVVDQRRIVLDVDQAWLDQIFGYIGC